MSKYSRDFYNLVYKDARKAVNAKIDKALSEGYITQVSKLPAMSSLKGLSDEEMVQKAEEAKKLNANFDSQTVYAEMSDIETTYGEAKKSGWSATKRVSVDDIPSLGALAWENTFSRFYDAQTNIYNNITEPNPSGADALDAEQRETGRIYRSNAEQLRTEEEIEMTILEATGAELMGWRIAGKFSGNSLYGDLIEQWKNLLYIDDSGQGLAAFLGLVLPSNTDMNTIMEYVIMNGGEL